MRGAGSKNSWALFLLILAGLVLGGFIGMLAEGSSAVGWLAYHHLPFHVKGDVFRGESLEIYKRNESYKYHEITIRI